jgi:phosphate transport system substrate-binding protein
MSLQGGLPLNAHRLSARLVAVVFLGAATISHAASPGVVQSGTIAVSGAFAIYPLMLSWSEAYQKANPSVRIDVSAGGAGKGMADVLGNLADIAMVSREVNPAEKEKGAWAVAVARDAVVGIASTRNPSIAALTARGMTKADAGAIWISGTVTTWGRLLANRDTHGINVYTRSDASGAADVWALFAGGRQEDLGGTGVFGDPGIVEAVKNDPWGIGYGNLNFVYDAGTKQPVQGVTVIPLDVDKDGRISPSEQFYTTRDDLVDAIADGRYPSPPSRELYLVTRGVPVKEIVKQFLAWILSPEGQKHVAISGYIALPEDRFRKQREELRK